LIKVIFIPILAFDNSKYLGKKSAIKTSVKPVAKGIAKQTSKARSKPASKVATKAPAKKKTPVKKVKILAKKK